MMTQRWNNLVMAIRKLPGVGPKMAERIALFLLRSTETLNILQAIKEAKEQLKRCFLCGTFTESDPCLRCSDKRRDPGLICVVEEVGDFRSVRTIWCVSRALSLIGRSFITFGWHWSQSIAHQFATPTVEK